MNNITAVSDDVEFRSFGKSFATKFEMSYSMRSSIFCLDCVIFSVLPY